jgi:hypothetical protein
MYARILLSIFFDIESNTNEGLAVSNHRMHLLRDIDPNEPTNVAAIV